MVLGNGVFSFFQDGQSKRKGRARARSGLFLRVFSLLSGASAIGVGKQAAEYYRSCVFFSLLSFSLSLSPKTRLSFLF